MVRMTDTTDRQVPELPDAENEMSRRYLRMNRTVDSNRRRIFFQLARSAQLRAFFWWVSLVWNRDHQLCRDLCLCQYVARIRRGIHGRVPRCPAGDGDSGGAVFVLYARFRARRLRASPTGIGPSGKLRHKVGRAGQGLFPREPVRQHGCRVGACVFAVAGLDRRGNVDDGCPRA